MASGWNEIPAGDGAPGAPTEPRSSSADGCRADRCRQEPRCRRRGLCLPFASALVGRVGRVRPGSSRKPRSRVSSVRGSAATTCSRSSNEVAAHCARRGAVVTVAVIDVETTGLSPRTDRIVELGVVLLDDRGEVEAEFETLLNPGRDVGPTNLHGIRAADVVEAPTFADVAPYLRSLLTGRVVVAHNALFDLRFLGRELARAGQPAELPPTLCTMRLAPLFFGPGTRSLQALCGFVDIPLVHGHAALHDARATAELMLHMLSSHLGEGSLAGAGIRVQFADDGGYRGFEALEDSWDELVDTALAVDVEPCEPCRTLPRDAATAAARDSYLGGLVAALPSLDDAPPSMAPYLTVL